MDGPGSHHNPDDDSLGIFAAGRSRRRGRRIHRRSAHAPSNGRRGIRDVELYPDPLPDDHFRIRSAGAALLPDRRIFCPHRGTT